MIEQTHGTCTFLTDKWPLDTALPTIVMIHGAGNSADFWTHQVQGLAAVANVIAVDLPGHGRSTQRAMSDVSDYAKWVDAFIRETGIPRPIPCGLSMGGAITLQLLVDGSADYTAGIVVNSGARLKVTPMIFDLLETDFNGYIDTIDQFAVSQKTDKNRIAFILDGLRDTAPAVIAGDFRACDTFDAMDRISDISVPVLVLTASDDLLTPPKFGAFLAEKITEGRTEQIADAGHLSPVEQPDRVNAAIRSFIQQLP